MNHYTSLEQSNKLLELGLDPGTADMFWDLAEPEDRRKPVVGRTDEYVGKDWFIPCWSVGALLEAIPDIQMYTVLIAKQGCNYGTCITPLDSELSLLETEGDSSIEVIYSLVVKLLKNNYIAKKC